MSRFFARFLLAIPRILWYAVLGAVSSTPVGGSPRSFSGVIFFFCPQSYREGVVRMVTWQDLFEFGLFLIALISLVLQEHDNKKK